MNQYFVNCWLIVLRGLETAAQSAWMICWLHDATLNGPKLKRRNRFRIVLSFLKLACFEDLKPEFTFIVKEALFCPVFMWRFQKVFFQSLAIQGFQINSILFKRRQASKLYFIYRLRHNNHAIIDLFTAP